MKKSDKLPTLEQRAAAIISAQADAKAALVNLEDTAVALADHARELHEQIEG